MLTPFISALIRKLSVILICIITIAACWATVQHARGPARSDARNYSASAPFTATQGPAPTLGNYANASVTLSANTTITPDATPGNTTSVNVFTSTDFKGTFTANPVSGFVTVTDAHPAGTYTVMVRAFGAGTSTTKTFSLTVTNGAVCAGAPSFTSAADVTAGADVRSVTVGDFNNDGKQDIAIANFGAQTVSIRLGNGLGGFSGAPDVSVGIDPRSVAIGDFNGDGKQDFACANFSSGTVSIRLGDGAGGFASNPDVSVGFQSSSMAIGDFNNDGKQDIASASSSLSAVSIRLGDGAGGFSGTTEVGVGSGPFSIAIGDFNKDGSQDIATANINSNTVSIRLGDGAGGFSGSTNVIVGTNPQAVAIGDFNNDGQQDFAAGNNDSNAVAIRLGDGAGGFSSAADVTVGASPQAAVGDFNNDGKQDLAAGNTGAATVSVRSGNGLGGFTFVADVIAGSGPISVAIGDFNNDGKQDFATAHFGSNKVSIRLGQCNNPGPAAGNTITVNSTSEVANGSDGLCTLREAITAANTNTASGGAAGECGAGSNSGPDAINFTATGTITLTSALPDIVSDMSFNGPGANLLTVQRSTAGATPDFRIFFINFNVNTGKTVSISGLTISNGRSNLGGGVANLATLTVTNCIISGNTTSGMFSGGGGIYSASASVTNVLNSTISGNAAQTGSAGGDGGGIYSQGKLNIFNSTISGNTGARFGGGLSINSGANIANCTISGNSSSAGTGGGIDNRGDILIRNTIVANSLSNLDVAGNVFNTQGHNLIGKSNPGNFFVDGVNGDQVGTPAAPIDPVLSPLQSNGGPTPTHALLPGSSAIDGGDNCVTQAAHCGDANIPQLTTDQRGFVNRSVDGDGDATATVDIGAFESRGGFAFSFTSGSPQSTAVTTAFALPLTAAVSSAFGEPVAGGLVTFTAPVNGPSATFPGAVSTFKATISASNQASVIATANGVGGGPYNVSAGAKGIPTTVTYSLTNTNGNATAPTSTGVSSSSNPSDLSQSVTFTATVTSASGTPTGTVQFKIDGANSGAPVALNASGVAQLTTSSLTAGTHTIAADYNGDPNFAGSTGTLAGGQVVRSQPAFSVNDVSITEGDTGTKTINLTVTLSAASNLIVKVDYVTANGTATAPFDYLAVPATTLTFNPGDLTKTVSVTINGDQTFEANETFFVNLSNPINASISDAQGVGTIVNDDAQGGIFSFSLSNYNVSESANFITITVNRTGDSSFPATVDYKTDDTGANAACGTNNGKASSRCDYTTAIGTLKFAAGDTSKTFNVLLSQDIYLEGSETFGLNLTNPTGGAVFGVPSSAMVTILDNANPGSSNPIDDVQFFVRQHYHDFLSREPDQAGLTFWMNQITSCGSNAQCTEARRIDVSASFFLSIEFQQTGYLVERFYKVAYGAATGNSTFGSVHQLSVPIVRFEEFLKDTQRIGEGVIVLQPGWEQALENNKQAYALEFVQTARFTAANAFPTIMTPAEFVDKLNLNAGNVLSPSERTTAINLFGGAANTSNVTARAQAIRQVADDTDLFNAEFNRAFVLAEYFGYLRRNPNDAPEPTLDYTGYDFWLTKLNQFNGNYINAEMVKAFLSSIEYRQRFGP